MTSRAGSDPTPHLPEQSQLTLTWQMTQTSRSDPSTASKIQQAQFWGTMEQAAQNLIAHKVAGGARQAELLQTGEAWSLGHPSATRLGEPDQIQQPQHLGGGRRGRLQIQSRVAGGRG